MNEIPVLAARASWLARCACVLLMEGRVRDAARLTMRAAKVADDLEEAVARELATHGARSAWN